jgi:hypothetical protein
MLLSRDSRGPSTIASCGTGEEESTALRSSWEHFWERAREVWFPLRLFQAWKINQVKQPHVNEREGFFRFDVKFKKMPALDEVRGMEETGRLAREAALASPLVRDLARRLRAELFFFELDSSGFPQFRNRTYHCVGNIYCRLGTRTRALGGLLEELSRLSALFRCQGGPVRCDFSGPGCRDEYGRFRKGITLRVRSCQEPFDIRLEDGEGSETYKISGSPFSLDRLVRQQKLNAYFGTADHRTRRYPDTDGEAPSRKRRKLG